MNHRQAILSGDLYPSDPSELRALVGKCLSMAVSDSGYPKAIIAPHAGYSYSGPIAAAAYAQLSGCRSVYDRVVLIGHGHGSPTYGVAIPSDEFFVTPLGQIEIDSLAIELILKFPWVHIAGDQHSCEHSLEVHLPFLQETLEDFILVPLIVGHVCPSEMEEVLETLCLDEKTLLVVSSDLSHYHTHEETCELNQKTALAIEELNIREIYPERACGAYPIRGLLRFAQKHRLKPKTLGLASSNEAIGFRDDIVGYGAWGFYNAR